MYSGFSLRILSGICSEFDSLSDFLSGIHSYSPAGIDCEIVFGILSGILSGIYVDILLHVASVLAFVLASVLAMILAF